MLRAWLWLLGSSVGVFAGSISQRKAGHELQPLTQGTTGPKLQKHTGFRVWGLGFSTKQASPCGKYMPEPNASELASTLTLTRVRRKVARVFWPPAKHTHALRGGGFVQDSCHQPRV